MPLNKLDIVLLNHYVARPGSSDFRANKKAHMKKHVINYKVMKIGFRTISRRPDPPRDHSTLYISFFDFCLFNCHTLVLVISPIHYYVTLFHIT